MRKADTSSAAIFRPSKAGGYVGLLMVLAGLLLATSPLSPHVRAGLASSLRKVLTSSEQPLSVGGAQSKEQALRETRGGSGRTAHRDRTTSGGDAAISVSSGVVDALARQTIADAARARVAGKSPYPPYPVRGPPSGVPSVRT